MGDMGLPAGRGHKSEQHECHLERRASSGKGETSMVLPRLDSPPDSETEGSMHGSSSEEGSSHGSSAASDSLRGLNRGSSFGSSTSVDGLTTAGPRLVCDDYETGIAVAETQPEKPEVPVYVMLPLDTVSRDGVLQNPELLYKGLRLLKTGRVVGVMMDIWWGVVERGGPRQYDWTAYKELIQLVKRSHLKVQAVMSFHACGGNVNDTYSIPLPPWVLEIGQRDMSIFYTDKGGYRNTECLSLWCDQEPVLAGRSPIQVYTDFMESFKEALGEDLGPVVVEIAVGMGPCGELRYPSYPEQRWRFPGVGEFQCYDERAKADLARAAIDANCPEWGLRGPHNAGAYNNTPQQTEFFKMEGSWSTAYGHFFLEWYSSALVAHGERMLKAACKAIYGIDSSEWASEEAAHGRKVKRYRFPREVHLSIKCAGVHWWYKSRSHAAELTAGYYNTRTRDGYEAVVGLCRKYGADLNFTCVEMRDRDQPSQNLCSPEALLKQVRVTASKQGVPVAGENALPRLDSDAFEVIVDNMCRTQVEIEDFDMHGNAAHTRTEHSVPPMCSLTFLRWSSGLLQQSNFDLFKSFVRRMQEAGKKGYQLRQARLLHRFPSQGHNYSLQSPRHYSTPGYFSPRMSLRESPRSGARQPRLATEVAGASAGIGSL
eukprot:TRINITY_DN19248_c0_g1_i1.p1 TRINITY_DN19248_c0_g1~~TRINITY_DN19248_c0_g1_i1.p1  ORF type:complete len:656 (+),score=81.79 TRINITY_DN19248_c0_g1_i1:376-2343(+)